MNLADFTDAQLMELYKHGQSDAFAQLFGRHQDRVVRIAARFTGKLADAEEILQEVFLRVARAAPAYEPTALFTTWLYRITVNCCCSHKKKTTRLKLVPFPGNFEGAATDDTYESARKRELRSRLGEEVAALPAPLKASFVLREFEGLTYAEAAAALALPVGTVKTHVHRARARLRRTLARELSCEGSSGGKAVS